MHSDPHNDAGSEHAALKLPNADKQPSAQQVVRARYKSQHLVPRSIAQLKARSQHAAAVEQERQSSSRAQIVAAAARATLAHRSKETAPKKNTVVRARPRALVVDTRQAQAVAASGTASPLAATPALDSATPQPAGLSASPTLSPLSASRLRSRLSLSAPESPTPKAVSPSSNIQGAGTRSEAPPGLTETQGDERVLVDAATQEDSQADSQMGAQAGSLTTGAHTDQPADPTGATGIPAGAAAGAAAASAADSASRTVSRAASRITTRTGSGSPLVSPSRPVSPKTAQRSAAAAASAASRPSVPPPSSVSSSSGSSSLSHSAASSAVSNLTLASSTRTPPPGFTRLKPVPRPSPPPSPAPAPAPAEGSASALAAAALAARARPLDTRSLELPSSPTSHVSPMLAASVAARTRATADEPALRGDFPPSLLSALNHEEEAKLATQLQASETSHIRANAVIAAAAAGPHAQRRVDIIEQSTRRRGEQRSTPRYRPLVSWSAHAPVAPVPRASARPESRLSSLRSDMHSSSESVLSLPPNQSVLSTSPMVAATSYATAPTAAAAVTSRREEPRPAERPRPASMHALDLLQSLHGHIPGLHKPKTKRSHSIHSVIRPEVRSHDTRTPVFRSPTEIRVSAASSPATSAEASPANSPVMSAQLAPASSQPPVVLSAPSTDSHLPESAVYDKDDDAVTNSAPTLLRTHSRENYVLPGRALLRPLGAKSRRESTESARSEPSIYTTASHPDSNHSSLSFDLFANDDSSPSLTYEPRGPCVPESKKKGKLRRGLASLFGHSHSDNKGPRLSPVPTPMMHTLRDDSDRKNFNEDKPWKGHHGLNHLSERERKRYEALWAANRRIHLPYLYVAPEYEDAWQSALHSLYPDLFVAHQSANASRISLLDRDQPRETPHDLPRAASREASHEASRELPRGGSFESSREASREALRDARDSLEDVGDNALHSVASPASSDGVDLAHADPGAVVVDIEKQARVRGDDVHGYVVSRIWRRSRLPEETLREIWELVDLNRDGTLDRGGFVVGMWLCDQCLYGRKLPPRVPEVVWNSVGKLHLKVRVKPRVSTMGYVKNIPNIFGSALGHTMHGGRRAVKKAVQTATS